MFVRLRAGRPDHRRSRHLYSQIRTFIVAKIKWVHDPYLDKTVKIKKNLKPLISVKNLILTTALLHLCQSLFLPHLAMHMFWFLPFSFHRTNSSSNKPSVTPISSPPVRSLHKINISCQVFNSELGSRELLRNVINGEILGSRTSDFSNSQIYLQKVSMGRSLVELCGKLDSNYRHYMSSLAMQSYAQISAQNLTMKRLRGYEIKAGHWDTFYKFYRNTTDNKWGSAYLTRDFFHNMASKMGDDVLLIVAEEAGEFVAGALNLIGGNALYGRLWGCLPEAYYPSLHFEACYYQAIEAAIEMKLDRVEAGAQGEHKIQRGYLPVTTYSSHYIQDEDFREVIADFLEREAAQVKLAIKLLNDSGPFKEVTSS